jgi:integrase/recombinase XerD
MTDQINLFKQYLSEQEKMSETTRACYVSDIRTYAEYLRMHDIDAEQAMTRTQLEKYRRWLLENGRSVSKVNRSMTAVRCFCKAMGQLGQMDSDPSRGMRNMPVEHHRVNAAEETVWVEEMLAAEPATPRASRDLAMMHLLAGTDLLVQELLQLNVQDVDTTHQQLHVKGHTEPLQLPAETWTALARYLSVRHTLVRQDNKDDALFLNWVGGRLSRQGFWKVACQYSERAGSGQVNLQALRAYSSRRRYAYSVRKKAD